MSGGSYDYFCFKLKEVSEQVIHREDHQPTRQIISKLLARLGKIMHEVEWEDSGDGGSWKKVDGILKKIFDISNLSLERVKKLQKYDMIEKIIKESNP